MTHQPHHTCGLEEYAEHRAKCWRLTVSQLQGTFSVQNPSSSKKDIAQPVPLMFLLLQQCWQLCCCGGVNSWTVYVCVCVRGGVGHSSAPCVFNRSHPCVVPPFYRDAVSTEAHLGSFMMVDRRKVQPSARDVKPDLNMKGLFFFKLLLRTASNVAVCHESALFFFFFYWSRLVLDELWSQNREGEGTILAYKGLKPRDN